MVMLILKRRYEFWLAMMALHKLGAVAIPATHMLTDKDIVYRNNRASIKAIICVDDKYVMEQVKKSEADSPSLKVLIGVGDNVHDEFHDWRKEWKSAPNSFVRNM
jgi:acetyl-CoA synthetase